MSETWIAVGRRIVAFVLTAAAVIFLRQSDWPVRAESELGYWLLFGAYVVLVFGLAGLIFKLIAGIGFWRGIAEWILINLAIVGVLAVLFPEVFQSIFDLPA